VYYVLDVMLLASVRVIFFFHVSLLKKYVLDPNNIIDWTVTWMEKKGIFWVDPQHILDQKVKFSRKIHRYGKGSMYL
jgi:hypothetical protein